MSGTAPPRDEQAAEAALLVGRRRVSLPAAGRLTIGRDPASDLVLEDSRVSWRHAEITTEDGRATVRDLGSSNGTWLAGRRLASDPVALEDDAAFTIGDVRIRYRGGGDSSTSTGSRRAFRRVALDRRLVIGRAPDSDVVL